MIHQSLARSSARGLPCRPLLVATAGIAAAAGAAGFALARRELEWFALASACLLAILGAVALWWRRSRAAAGDGAQHRLLFESNPVPLFVYDWESLRLLEVNDAAVAQYGLPRERLLEMTIADLVPEEDRATLKARRKAGGGRLVRVGLRRHLRGEGTPIFVEIMRQDLDYRGHRVVLTAAIDVTPRALAEEQLRASEAHLARAQRLANCGSAERDFRTGEVKWSDEHFAVLGLEPGAVTPSAAAFRRFLHPEDEARVVAAMERQLDGVDPGPLEFRIVRPDGAVRYVQLESYLSRDESGKPLHRSTTIQDVTERWHAQRELRRSQQHLARAQRIAGTGSVERNLKDGTVHWSDEMFRVLGYEPGAVPASPEFFHSCVHPEDRVHLAAARHDNAKGIASPPREYRIVRPNGAIRVIYRENEVAFDDEGRPEFAIATLKDVTELRAVEERQRELEQQLFHSQRLEALGRLAGGIAHDLNNTLVPILALAKVTARELEEDSPKRANLEIILAAGERARDLVRRILAFSRKQALAKEQVNLADIAREALKMMRPTLPASVQILESIAEVPPILGDAGQLHQILVNLMTNAAQAIAARPGTITVALAMDDASLALSIADTGCGMDAETREHIFEPFFTTKSVGDGTGLGLAVVHGIVTGHGGRIEVESAPGAGTRFTVRLPLPAAGQETVAAE